MEQTLTLTAVKSAMKQEVAANIAANLENLVQIGDAEFVVPMENAQFGTQYIGIEFSAKDTKGTKETAKSPARAGFNLETAVAEYAQLKVARAEKAAKAAAEKAAKAK